MMLRRYHEKVEVVEYTFEQLDDMKVPQIKEILESKQIDYKSNDTKKELISYLVEIPEEQPDGETSDDDGDDS